MKKDWRYYFSSIFLCAVFFQTQVSAQTGMTAAPSPTPEASAADAEKKTIIAEENLIHSGDLIDVDILGSTDYDWRGRLNPEGFLNGVKFTENPIYALCQTEESVAEKVAAAYARLLRAPQVSVKILDRSQRPVSVLFGAVKKNQRFQIKRPILLNELIVISGGFTDKASGEIQIYRPQSLNCLSEVSKPREQATGESGEKSGESAPLAQTADSQYISVKITDLLAGKSNPQILSGDIVTVLEAKPIYVIGAVGVPKQISVRAQQITLSRAVDSAGGLLKGADAKKITIFRRGENGGETKIIEADLDKIKAATAEDVSLQAFDIVEVAETGREKRKFPPVLKTDNSGAQSAQNLPLRVID